MRSLKWRFNQGRGRGRGHNLRTTYYSPDEWYNLKQEQRDWVQEARSIVADPGSQTTGRRRISGKEITPGARDDASAPTSPTAVTQSVANQPTASGNAGNRFGQHSRSLGALLSGSRQVSHVHMDLNPANKDFHGFVDLGTHADTCTIGANFCITAYTEMSCNVTPYHPKYESIDNCPIVQAATAYTDEETGNVHPCYQ